MYAATIITVLETVKSFWKIVSKEISQTERFRTKNALDVWKHMCESTYIFYDQAIQIYSKNRNWMSDETMQDSLRFAATNAGTAKGTIVSET